ncbi:MAG: right-handed parallel beta-helix repeat-containing protein [Spirochaetaceae bacterium]|nr:right-handed parallel beta-helix repeat-containing protein [Spirochaetaceae bacterium]
MKICIYLLIPIFLSCRQPYNSGEEINSPSDSGEKEIPSELEFEQDASYEPLASGSAIYYLDALNGSDDNPGTENAPFQSFEGLWSHLTGGEIVYLKNGLYDDYLARQFFSFSNWISFKPYPGHNPKLGRLTFQGWNGIEANTFGGLYSFYLDFIGLHFADGISLTSIKNIWIRGCSITRKGELTGSVEAISKIGIDIRNSGNIYIENTEMTRIATGLAAYGKDITIKDSHIHHMTHDGIQLTGVHIALVEGNRIYNADDGISDDSGFDWNRHNDGIHVYIRGNGNSSTYENQDVIIRGNTIYDIHGQGIQFNNYHYDPITNPFQNRNFLVENNIFGPTASPVFHVSEGEPVAQLVFRHNTVLDFGVDGRSFTGIAGRQTDCLSYHVDFSTQCTELEVYNNIFATRTAVSTSAIRRDHNMVQSLRGGGSALGRGSFIYEEPLFSNLEKLDGKLLPGVPAINGGTRLDANGQFVSSEKLNNFDFYGNQRDNRPDLGAFEEEGNYPELEEPLVLDSNPKTIFIDDFEDGDLEQDLWLDDPGVAGLSWTGSSQYSAKMNSVFNSIALSGPVGADGGTILLCEAGHDWEDYTLEFKATSYLPRSDGPVLLARDESNYYWLDIARETGRLLRVDNNVSTMLLQADDLRIPHGGIQHYKVKVKHIVSGGIQFKVWKNDSPVLDYTDISTESESFSSGRIGFHRYVDEESMYYHRIDVDDVKLTLD